MVLAWGVGDAKTGLAVTSDLSCVFVPGLDENV